MTKRYVTPKEAAMLYLDGEYVEYREPGCDWQTVSAMTYVIIFLDTDNQFRVLDL